MLRSGKFWGTALVLAIGAMVGVIGWGGFNWAMESTNSVSFCTSCHEMRDTVYPEYMASIHYSNPAGVRAICSDCHVPKEWTHKVIRKIQATGELYHKLVGTIDTKEKFEAERLALAREVWATMKATDSRECRNCHSFAAMDFHKQRPKAAEAMQKAMKDGATCIDCHKGIAHKLPDMTAGYRTLFAALTASARTLSARPGDTVWTLATIPFALDRPDGAEISPAAGKILPETPLKVLERDGERLRVRLEGWQQQGAERVIYTLQGKRIFAAALTPGAIEKVEPGKAMTDPDTDQVWTPVGLEAWVIAGTLVGDRDRLFAYGAELYGGTCGICHSLPPPGNYLANQWIGNLDAMKRFVSLDDEQFRFLQKYVQLNAQDTGARPPGGAAKAATP
ncbi:MAG: NapC/NirT family cytochrome c [Dongiaceae bacterium]